MKKKVIYNIHTINGTASGTVNHMVINYAPSDMSSKNVHLTMPEEGADSKPPSPDTTVNRTPVLPNKYVPYITTEHDMDTIGKRLVCAANGANTKQKFVSILVQIVNEEKLFRFNPMLSNAQKAEFCNMVLHDYDYQGCKCKNIHHDSFAGQIFH